MSSATLGIDLWLETVLGSDATLTAILGSAGRVHAEQAPAGSAFPLVVFRSLSLDDVMSASQDRVMVSELRAVEAIAQTMSFADVKAAAERIDALLHHLPAAGSTTVGAFGGVTILSSTRLRELRLVESDTGRHFRRLGGIYQINAQ
jgi:hypothetical protein